MLSVPSVSSATSVLNTPGQLVAKPIVPPPPVQAREKARQRAALRMRELTGRSTRYSPVPQNAA